MAGLVQKQLQQGQQQLSSTRCLPRPSLNVRRVRSPAVSVQAYLTGATRSSFVSGGSSWASSISRQLSHAGSSRSSSSMPMK